MKRNLKRNALIVCFSAMTMAGCQNGDVSPEANEVRPVEIPESVSAATTDFAFTFFKEFQATENPNGNIFISPLSLHMALGMVLNGAEGQTKEELRKALKTENISEEELNKAYSTLINDLPVADSKVSLGLANSMWHKPEFVVEQSFKDVLSKTFNAEVTGLPFHNTAVGKINQWASDHTNGKIKQVLEQVRPDDVMFILNALYFKGDWQTRFDASKTTDAMFTKTSGEGKQVKMMLQTSAFEMAQGTNYRALRLPYANGQYNMTLILPSEGGKIQDVMNSLTLDEWNILKKNRFQELNVKVGLPKFTMNYSAYMDAALQKSGMSKAYTRQAEFARINKTTEFFVSFVKQDSYLGIDEAGTEAAAVTTIGFTTTNTGPGSTPEFICNRPFGLVISEKTSDTILFMGRIMDPDR